MNAELDLKTIHIVNDTETLNECLKELKKTREVAVDTESDSLFVYFEKVVFSHSLSPFFKCFLSFLIHNMDLPF